MKRILAPTDFSSVSVNAVKYAAEFCRDTQSELVLLHILEGTSVEQAVDITGEVEEMEKTDYQVVEEKLIDLCDSLKDKCNCNCRYVIKHGNLGFLSGLIHKIEHSHFDLVVLGTSGASNIAKFYLGSHSYRLAVKVSPPVLLVPKVARYNKLRRIVYASDYEAEDVSVLKSVLQLTVPLRAKVTVLHVSKKDTEAGEILFKNVQDLLEHDLDEGDISFDKIISKERIATAIDLYMIEQDQQLLVVLARDYSLIERLFHKSVTKEISQDFVYPLLIM